MALFEWWMDKPAWLRALLSLILIGISTAIYFAGYFWPWGWAIGGIMLALSMPSKKTHDWGEF